MEKIFQIGPFCFKLCYTEDIQIPTSFLRFEKPIAIPEYTYQIDTADVLPTPAGQLIAKRPDIAIFHTDDLESRLIGVKGNPTYYACYQELANDRAQVTFRMDQLKELHIDPVFSSLLALERRMLMRDSLIFHCAYLRYHDQAILFSAPSGVGKSTQAGLWETYQQGETINGDRALLNRTNGKWTAHGWPVSGTSGICQNRSTPIRAIVMLSQSPDNHVEAWTGLEAVGALYAQTTVNYWNVPAVTKCLNLLEQLAGQVPIYHLSCNISEDAVLCLKSALDASCPE